MCPHMAFSGHPPCCLIVLDRDPTFKASFNLNYLLRDAVSKHWELGLQHIERDMIQSSWDTTRLTDYARHLWPDALPQSSTQVGGCCQWESGPESIRQPTFLLAEGMVPSKAENLNPPSPFPTSVSLWGHGRESWASTFQSSSQSAQGDLTTLDTQCPNLTSSRSQCRQQPGHPKPRSQASPSLHATPSSDYLPVRPIHALNTTFKIYLWPKTQNKPETAEGCLQRGWWNFLSWRIPETVKLYYLVYILITQTLVVGKGTDVSFCPPFLVHRLPLCQCITANGHFPSLHTPFQWYMDYYSRTLLAPHPPLCSIIFIHITSVYTTNLKVYYHNYT